MYAGVCVRVWESVCLRVCESVCLRVWESVCLRVWVPRRVPQLAYPSSFPKHVCGALRLVRVSVWPSQALTRLTPEPLVEFPVWAAASLTLLWGSLASEGALFPFTSRLFLDDSFPGRCVCETRSD